VQDVFPPQAVWNVLGIRGPNPVPECSGTGQRCRMPGDSSITAKGPVVAIVHISYGVRWWSRLGDHPSSLLSL
jgi:hypothetical protein